MPLRSYDFVARYGGEEFLVVLNSCDPAFAPGRAEELRKSVSNRAIQTAKGSLNLTMSLGALMSSDWGLRPVEKLLHEVDTALYKAKASGRDCLRIAQPVTQTELSTAPLPQSVRLGR